VEATCPSCGETILLSRASQTRMRQGYQAFCVQCIRIALAKDPVRIQPEFPTTEVIADALGFREKN
jgi:hypothetical protein